MHNCIAMPCFVFVFVFHMRKRTFYSNHRVVDAFATEIYMWLSHCIAITIVCPSRIVYIFFVCHSFFAKCAYVRFLCSLRIILLLTMPPKHVIQEAINRLKSQLEKITIIINWRWGSSQQQWQSQCGATHTKHRQRKLWPGDSIQATIQKPQSAKAPNEKFVVQQWTNGKKRCRSPYIRIWWIDNAAAAGKKLEIKNTKQTGSSSIALRYAMQLAIGKNYYTFFCFVHNFTTSRISSICGRVGKRKVVRCRSNSGKRFAICNHFARTRNGAPHNCWSKCIFIWMSAEFDLQRIGKVHSRFSTNGEREPIALYNFHFDRLQAVGPRSHPHARAPHPYLELEIEKWKHEFEREIKKTLYPA